MNRNRIEKFLSAKRLQAYWEHGLQLPEALCKYEENLLFCTRYFVVAHFLEIALRNEINEILRAELGENWFARPDALLHPQTQQLKDARSRLQKKRKPRISTDDIVAELSLGFWVGILGPRYEKDQQYWRKYLHKGFVHRPKGCERKQLHAHLDSIRHFRNRAFHHERILHNKPAQKLSECLEAIEWINKDAHAWAVEMLKRIP